MSENRTVRVNVTISQFIKKYFEEKSEETGVSQSALMAMALGEYIEQKNALGTMQEMVAKLKSLESLDNQK